MIKTIFNFFISTLFFLFNNPAYSKVESTENLDKYINKISSKFSRTYCNTTKFGISEDGAIAFAIGETNKEFKNNKLNKIIDHSRLNNNIVVNIENVCQIYDFPIIRLDELKLDK